MPNWSARAVASGSSVVSSRIGQAIVRDNTNLQRGRKGQGKTWGTAEPSMIPAAECWNLDIRVEACSIAACADIENPGHPRALAVATHFNVTRNKLATAGTACRTGWPIVERPAQAAPGHSHRSEKKVDNLIETLQPPISGDCCGLIHTRASHCSPSTGRNGSERGDKAKVWKVSCQCCRLRPHNGVALEQAAV